MSNSIRTLARRAALAAATGAAALFLAACGGDGADRAAGGAGHADAGSPTPSGAHNPQDVAFAQGMIPHHRQALEMARLAGHRASSGAVKDLAGRIEKAQDPEIRTMTGWLKTWGEDVVPTATDGGTGHSGSGHSGSGHSGMPGMMGEQDMAALEMLTGKAFDFQFLTLMVEHHEGAVEMARTERSKGRYAPAKAMADDIVTAQNAEIREMNKLLGKGENESKS
ncbi:DUF305 domain-containing protein [Streptomyces sp. NPDC093598]|uniref:DUF305 domain-containing protein n=1 Tax=Streptomyces sp. NPDC093598 TaxID=3366046 RepID=UPI003817A7B2